MAHISDIPFHAIPRQSALFLSYLESSPAALRFYQYAPTMEGLENAARGRIKDAQFPREEIASILERQNKGYGCDATTLGQISALRNPDSVAILTGQQVGFFTGPLYTIYKALTAIQIAGELKKRGFRAIPIFWMDTEDHDLREVTLRTVLNPNSSLENIDFRSIFSEEPPACSVGSIPLPEAIREAVQNYLSHFPDSDEKPGLKLQLESTYRSGATLAQSFAELLLRILPGSGLILFNPQDAEAKRLASAVFQTALQKEDAVRNALLQRNQQLEQSGFHSQVKVLENSTVLFLTKDGERRALERKDSRFRLKNTDRTCGLDELLDAAAGTPERFSPNVLLRPLVQDHLFPTVAYVGGSSEVAYFAQIEALYEMFDCPMPVIWPRHSLTLVEPEVGAEMDRLGVGVQDCFHGKQILAEKTVQNADFSKAAATLDKLGEHLDQILTEVKPDMQAVEPPLAQALETARRKILHNVQHLKSQVIRFEGIRNSSTLGIIDLLLNNCYPYQNLQERELGIHHFLARHGSSVLDDIRAAMDLGSFAHRVLRL
jgi:bacillithiol biosynthesis cysteine-adding enzyme BshC